MRFLSDRTVDRLRRAVAEPDLSGTPYRLLRPLASGGMATVFLAEDVRLGREVALKVLHHPAPASAAERMEREARIIARLEHPGIVPVHDVGTLADGRVYYAMKRLDGERLDELLARRPPLAERLRVFHKVCEAVAFAHAHGVVHRDLKPENVMAGAFGEVQVMDWGLAKSLREPEPAALREDGDVADVPEAGAGAGPATSHGTVLGTPGYMPPEQARGELARVDERADVYALGVLLFVMLTGRLPGDETPPEPRHPRESDPSVPKGLDAVCAKATDPQPERRYADASGLASEAERFLDGLPVAAHRESVLDRVARLGKKYRVALLLVATYLAVRVGILVFLGR